MSNNVISTEALIAKFQQALDDHWGYIWGTAGVTWTAARQKQLEQTTDADRANSRLYGKQWIGHTVADCSGLFRWAFRQLGGDIAHGSNSIWDRYCSAKGELKNGKREDGKTLKPGTAVFTYNKTKKNRGHIGLYIGNGWVIEAQGAKAGVVKSKITNTKWVEWGELKGVRYDADSDEPATAPAKDETGVPPTLQKGSKGEYVQLLQTKLLMRGYDLGSYGVDGDFGSKTLDAVKAFQKSAGLTVDGVVGPQTWQALEQPAEAATYTVTIRGLSQAQADRIIAEYGGIVTTE